MKTTIVYHLWPEIKGQPKHEPEPYRVTVADAKMLVARYPQWYRWLGPGQRMVTISTKEEE